MQNEIRLQWKKRPVVVPKPLGKFQWMVVSGHHAGCLNCQWKVMIALKKTFYVESNKGDYGPDIRIQVALNDVFHPDR